MAEQKQRWGRFALALPAGMKLHRAAHQVRYADVEAVAWLDGEEAEAGAARVWAAKLAELRTRFPPSGISDVVIETQTFDDDDRLHAAACYYSNEDFADEAAWIVLAVDAAGGLWVERSAPIHAKEALLERVLDVARGHRNPAPEGVAGYFLEVGVIALPYLYTEALYVEFRGSGGDEVLTIETDVIDDDTPEPEYGLAERLVGVVASGFAEGVTIDTLLSGSRTVAGMDGEEVAVRVEERGKLLHDFLYEYPGEIENGQRPRLRVDLTLPAADVDAQALAWGRLLDSFEVVG